MVDRSLGIFVRGSMHLKLPENLGLYINISDSFYFSLSLIQSGKRHQQKKKIEGYPLLFNKDKELVMLYQPTFTSQDTHGDSSIRCVL